MLIAYDLRYAADHFTGIGTHAYCLLEALLELPGDDRYAVLWDGRQRHRRYDPAAFSSHRRVSWNERAIAPLHPLSPLAVGRWLREVRPDVYLSPFYLQPAGPRCACALTLHDVWPLRLPQGMSPARRLLFRWSLRRARAADALLTSSRFSRGEIVELLGIPADRVHAIPLGVPPARGAVEPRRPEGIPDGPFALVVGDNRPRKNLELLARAWGALGAPPPLALVAAGPVDPRYPTLRELAAGAGAGVPAVLGWRDEAELAWLYDHAACVLFPSLYEGFGFPMVEAFARGVPVLAADVPTLREVGEDGAWFLDPRNPADWADAVRALAADPARDRRWREAGRARALALTYRRTAEATLEVLRAVARVDSTRAGR